MVMRINIVLLITLFLPINLVSANNQAVEEEFFDEIYAVHSLEITGELNEYLLKFYKIKLVVLRDRYIRKGGDNYKAIGPADLYIQAADELNQAYADLWLRAADAILSNPDNKLTKEETEKISAPIIASGKERIVTYENRCKKLEEAWETAIKKKISEKTDVGESIQQIEQSLCRALKSKFISSRTREFKYASYMRDWVQKVERVGELNYPDSARRQHLSGKLIVLVALYSDGSVREISIRKPSGHKILDAAVVRIVKLASPFAPFPENLKKEADILYITRTWVFTSDNRLESR